MRSGRECGIPSDSPRWSRRSRTLASTLAAREKGGVLNLTGDPAQRLLTQPHGENMSNLTFAQHPPPDKTVSSHRTLHSPDSLCSGAPPSFNRSQPVVDLPPMTNRNGQDLDLLIDDPIHDAKVTGSPRAKPSRSRRRKGAGPARCKSEFSREPEENTAGVRPCIAADLARDVRMQQFKT